MRSHEERGKIVATGVHATAHSARDQHAGAPASGFDTQELDDGTWTWYAFGGAGEERGTAATEHEALAKAEASRSRLSKTRELRG